MLTKRPNGPSLDIPSSWVGLKQRISNSKIKLLIQTRNNPSLCRPLSICMGKLGLRDCLNLKMPRLDNIHLNCWIYIYIYSFDFIPTYKKMDLFRINTRDLCLTDITTHVILTNKIPYYIYKISWIIDWKVFTVYFTDFQ